MSSFKKMFGNRGFQLAFLVSVLIHGVAFSGLGFSKNSSRKIRPSIEINYYRHKSPSILEIKDTPRLESTPPKAEAIIALKGNIKEEKKLFAKESVKIRERDSAKSNTRAGLEYYEVVREKIRNSVKYSSRAPEGDIFLSFVLSRDGHLETKPAIVDKESSDEPALRQAALRGIIASSPFPPFPDDISGNQVTFNIVISFRMSNTDELR